MSVWTDELYIEGEDGVEMVVPPKSKENCTKFATDFCKVLKENILVSGGTFKINPDEILSKMREN